ELALRIKQIGEGAFARERAGRERRDELLRRPGQNAAHGRAALLKPADQVERLVGGNAAADHQKNALAVEHRHILARRYHNPQIRRHASSAAITQSATAVHRLRRASAAPIALTVSGASTRPSRVAASS